MCVSSIDDPVLFVVLRDREFQIIRLVVEVILLDADCYSAVEKVKPAAVACHRLLNTLRHLAVRLGPSWVRLKGQVRQIVYVDERMNNTYMVTNGIFNRANV